ncbi:amino acid adenylation domain-containing protein [Scytonema sp. PCC 10023]|uniref:amino acid adenylation domain-containing protein n=1 Tax=Scytonema sp. PCC 10023 TaxID=1680591 RepID=UPI0039C714AF
MIELEERQILLESYLQAQVAKMLKIALSQVDLQQPLNSLGLDSLSRVELKNCIETDLGVIVSLADFPPDSNLAQLAMHVLKQQNETQVNYPENSCIHQLFEAQVERTPEAVAVIFEDVETRVIRSLSYRELNQCANQLAHYLQRQGVGSETLVGICVERSLEMIVGLLGILKAGGAYVPLDPTYPKERLAFMLEDACVPILLTQAQLVAELPAHKAKVVCLDSDCGVMVHESNENPLSTVSSENLAYTIYTSGSTGRPKGVMVTHNNLVYSTVARTFYYQEPVKNFLLVSSFAFDSSVAVIFWTLCFGGTLVLPKEGLHKDILQLTKLISQYQITHWLSVPSLYKALLTHGSLQQLVSLRTVIVAGELCSRELVDRHYQILPQTTLFNEYGPTEATVWSSVYRCQSDELKSSIPIGRAIANTQIYLLDEQLNPVPVGVPGELYIGGAGVARGYLNRPELTAEKFISNPLSEMRKWRELPIPQSPITNHHYPVPRLYKTGDLAQYLPEGNIEFLGRIDQQVKIRGFRIEVGEIEAILAKHPYVQEVVVLAQKDVSGEQRLVAYLVSSELSISELRHFLSEKLPDYMVPSAFVFLEALPLTPNGKVDRLALPVPDFTRSHLAKAFVAPRSESEKVLAEIWAQVLGIERVGIHDNFFELGGHSLLATELLLQVHDTFGVELTLQRLLELSTVDSLAAWIEQNAVKQKIVSTNVSTIFAIASNENQRYQPFPLTDVQQAYWLGRSKMFELGNVAAHFYLETESVDLDLERYNKAWQRLIERHEMLRAIILPSGEQQILDSVPPYEIQVLDLRGEIPEVVASQLETIRQEMSHQLLPTDTWPLFDIRASVLDDRRIRLHISFDLLIGDYWSFQILGKELFELYQNLDTSLPPLSVSFRDYVNTCVVLQNSLQYQRSKEYWLNRLPSLPPAPELPLQKHPSAIAPQREKSAITHPRFVRQSAKLEPLFWQQLKTRASQIGLTPSGVLLAAFAEVLTIWSKNPRFTINLTLFNRLPLHPQINEIVGDFTTLSLLTVDNSNPNSFEIRAQRIQQQLWSDLDHRYFDGVQVLRELTRTQRWESKALMPVVFTSTLSLPTASTDVDPLARFGEVVHSITQTPQVWLDHQVYEEAGTLMFNWDAVEELFPPGLLDDMFAAYCNLLQRLATNKSAWVETRRQLLPNAQIELFEAINTTTAPLSTQLLHTLFEAQVKQRPHHLAIVAPEGSFTYQELFEYSNALGYRLRQLGTQPNTLVAIVMEKGWEQVVAVLSILASGAAYVPIDPALPNERLTHLLQQAEVSLVLTQLKLNQTLELPSFVKRICVDIEEPLSEKHQPLHPVQQPEDLAYVIYTSGSTGMPKGVMIDHRGAVNTILDMNQRFGVNPCDRVLALSSLCFDLSVYDIFGTLAAGATIVIPKTEASKDPSIWWNLIEKQRVTIWNSVPALMQMLVEYASGRISVLDCLRLVLLSGDWVPLTLPDQIKTVAKNVQVISLGGATEASIWSILYPIESVDPSWKSIPYGRPMLNQQFYVLNESLEPCPVWVPGQLYIGGIGLAKGYWRDEEKTAASFITHPVTKAKLYRTGDLGYYLPDGNISFIGREDYQVKIGGYRIELKEIEAALMEHPAVHQAVVAAVGEQQNNKQLVAYVLPEREQGFTLFEVEGTNFSEIQQVWKSLVNSASQQAEKEPEGVNIQTLSAFLQAIEHLSTTYIRSTLTSLGVYIHPQEKHSLDSLMNRCQIQPYYRKLLGQWLSVLEKEKLLQREGQDTFVNHIPLQTDSLNTIWNEVKQYANSIPQGQNFLNYIERHLNNHSALLKGQIDPLDLLFPDGSLDTVESLYQSFPTAAYFNSLAREVVRSLVKTLPPGKPLRILEIGAGIGGTTASLLPVLPRERTLYTYTDVSAFFSNLAKKKFREYSFVEYKRLDIDQNPQEQGYQLQSFDLIVAANVLHVARNLGTTLSYIRSLLAPQGLLLLVELTEYSRSAMTTMGFVKGFSNYEDERTQENLPTLSVKQWQSILQLNAFEDFVAFPQSGSLNDLFGQHLIIARQPFSEKRLKQDELRNFLQKKLPEYMVPSAYISLNTLPLNSNGKVDRQALTKLSPIKLNPNKAFVAPRNTLEQIIAGIWTQILNLQSAVDIHHNFFELGGNSLKAIQIYNKLQEKLETEFPVVTMFEHPTVSALAQALSRKETRNTVFKEGYDRGQKRKEAALQKQRSSKNKLSSI